MRALFGTPSTMGQQPLPYKMVCGFCFLEHVGVHMAIVYGGPCGGNLQAVWFVVGLPTLHCPLPSLGEGK